MYVCTCKSYRQKVSSQTILNIVYLSCIFRVLSKVSSEWFSDWCQEGQLCSNFAPCSDSGWPHVHMKKMLFLNVVCECAVWSQLSLVDVRYYHLRFASCILCSAKVIMHLLLLLLNYRVLLMKKAPQGGWRSSPQACMACCGLPAITVTSF